MSIEVHTFTGYDQTPSGGYKFRAEDVRGSIFCFEPKAAKDVLDHIGQPVSVDIDRTPNQEGKVFPKVRSFHGLASATDAIMAASTAAAPAPVTNDTPRSGGGGSSSFKKDPVGIVLGSRQTALNAAVARAASCPNPESYDVIATAQAFNEFLLSGLSAEVLRDGLHVANVMPWKEGVRKAENTQAREALAAAAPAPAPDPAAVEYEDDIPF